MIWKKKVDPVPREYWRLNYNPPPTFPPPDWVLDLNEDLAREWRSVPKPPEKPQDK
ncbi:hypothetical protein ABIE56_000648 [Luteibacter sp. 621]|jgi:hypothetical protein|uniref:hypothetical protein n=1 Tax=Luteibacter sp. 621 TaxID=3373916 RepID=UPI003D1A2F42